MSSFGGVTIPFAKWQEACQRQKSPSGREVLQQEAKKLFSTLFSTTTLTVGTSSDGISLTTKPAHQQALAQLLRELGPCFHATATHTSRLWALQCLCGAVEGCQEISLVMMNLLGNFFLTYCSPLGEEDDNDDYNRNGEPIEELVRDAAVECLAALVKSVVTTSAASIPAPTGMETKGPDSILSKRLQLAQTGVERRCAMTEQNESFDHSYGDERHSDNTTHFRGGLSLLPRSRRALCFDLIRAAIDGIASAYHLQDGSSWESLASFASFAADCLHGESDPRCLLQLLNTLHALQHAFLPYFVPDVLNKFPTVHLFDAVAPYYPIQFTPPPNDKHGITRQGLQSALLAILSFAGFDETSHQTSMLNLSTGLITERIEDNDSTVQEKLDAVSDLTLLLATPTKLSPESIRALSHVLIATHEIGAEGVALGKHGPYKALADACRSLVSKVCADLEGNQDLWNVFVNETLQSDAALLATTPQSLKGRSTIAYMACLAASGGPRTLTATLESCLPRLYDALCQSEDDEKVAAAAYGLQAFFSSYEVAFGRATAKAICFFPHPLEAYCSKILLVLVDRFEKSQDDTTRSAAISATVSLLQVTPSELLVDEMVQISVTFVQAMCDIVALPERYQDVLCDAVSKSLGSVIATALDSGDSKLPSALRDNIELHGSIQDVIVPRLMKSCLDKPDTSRTRFDVLSIAHSCTYSRTMADQILNHIMSALEQNLKAGDNIRAIRSARLVPTILKEGKTKACIAFHQTQIDPVDIVKIIGNASSDDLRTTSWKPGLSMLELPSSSIEFNDGTTAISLGYEIVSQFLLAYQVIPPENRLKSLFDYMEHILPPLSEWQTVQLSICAPLFAATVVHNSMPESLLSRLTTAATPFAQFALDAQIYPPSRSDAAKSLFWIIMHHPQASEFDTCIAKRILEKTVFPEIRSRLRIVQDPQDDLKTDRADSLRDALNLASVLGAAAACRGGTENNKLSDDLARYFIKLAFAGQCKDPFEMNETVVFASGSQIQVSMQLAAASAFGSLISVESTGSLGPIWKQRLIHMVLTEFNTYPVSTDTRDPSFWGQLALLAETVACAKLSTISETMNSMLVRTFMTNLLLVYPKVVTSELANQLVNPDVRALQELLLAGIIKLIGSPRSDLSKHIVALLCSMLRVLSRGNLTGYGSMSLALQILCSISQFDTEKEKLVQFKPAVDSVLLTILDNQSCIFRQMVAETRNYWAIIS